MNKKIIIILLVILFLILGIFITLYCLDNYRMKNNEPVFFSTWGKEYSPIIEEQITEEEPNIEEEKEPEYVDENNVKLGIYRQWI